MVQDHFPKIPFKEADRSKKLSSGAYTRNARLNYADGLVMGLRDAVEAEKKAAKDKEEHRLAKARLAEVKGEAYESSDDEDEDGGNGGGGGGGGGSGSHDCQSDSDDGQDWPATVALPAGGGGDAAAASGLTPPSATPAPSASLSSATTSISAGGGGGGRLPCATPVPKDACAVVAEVEKSRAAVAALVVHNKGIAERVLKESGVKVSAAAKRKRVEFNWGSYAKGEVDSREIGLGQRVIKAGVKKAKKEDE